jgi:hypothetical protein
MYVLTSIVTHLVEGFCEGSLARAAPLMVLLCSRSRSYLENKLAVALGGRVAEELIFGPDCVTTGAANDFQQVVSARGPRVSFC